MIFITILYSIFAFLFGWIVFLFKNYPRIFFIGLIFFLLLMLLLYKLFSKNVFDKIVKVAKDIKLDKKSEKQLAATRVEADDDDKIAGLDTQIEEIYKQVTLPRSINPKLREDLGLRNVRGIILYGPPGTGKTMLARNLSKKLGCKSIKKISAVSLIDKYYGSTEEHIRELFIHKPGELHMVIFDEIDSICPTRTTGMNDSKFYTGVTNQLLSLMDGIDADPDVIVVGTTNNLSSIDPAILRPGRFDLHLKIELPNDNARVNIFRVYTEKLIEKGLMEKYNMESLIERTKGKSGADIENIIRKSITSALYRHTGNNNQKDEPFQITETDIIKAI